MAANKLRGRDCVFLVQLMSTFLCFLMSTSCDCAYGDASHEPPSALFSAVQIRESLRGEQTKIESMHVVYRGYSRLASQDEPSGRYVRREFWIKSPASVVYHGSHGHDALDWRDDPFQQVAYIAPGKSYNTFPLNRVYSVLKVAASDPLPGTLQHEPFLECTGIWPLAARPSGTALGQNPTLLEVSSSTQYDTVRELQENVAGCWCHVLERPGIDRLWLDSEKGFCLLKRKLLDPSSRQPVLQFQLSEHREASPGIWIPTVVAFQEFDLPQPINSAERLVRDVVINVLEASINKVDDSSFVFQPPPGSLEQRFGSQESATQTEPGGLDHLDSIADWARRVHPVRREKAWRFGYLCGVPVLLLFIWAKQRSWTRSHDPSMEVGRDHRGGIL